MSQELSRRAVLGMAAGAAATALPASKWIFALNGEGNVVRAATTDDWKPAVLTQAQADSLAVLVETIIPRTDTPGARDARVHEYIDIVLSSRYPEGRRSFLRGLNWLEGRCSGIYRKPISELAEGQCTELLKSISDENDDFPADLKEGAAFFRELKRFTIQGYYMSLEGRVEELGLPASPKMEVFRGCTHSGDDHSA